MLFEELGEVLHVQHAAVLIDADPQASLTASFGIRNADTLDTTLTNVYTIEGNTSDSCAERWYPIGHYEILGYGVPAY